MYGHPAKTLADLHESFPRVEIIKEFGPPAVDLFAELVHPHA
jgi:hypothetical protein